MAIGLYKMTYYDNLSRADWWDAQVGYGFSLSEDLVAGASYTYGLSEAPFSSNSRRRYSSFRNYSGYYDSSNTIEQYSTASDNRISSHTFRIGFSRQMETTLIDAVGTLEFISGKINFDQAAQYRYYYINIYSGSSSISDRSSLRSITSRGDVKSTNVRIDLRLMKPVNETSTFAAQLGGGLAFFSSDEVFKFMATQREFYQSPYDTNETLGNSLLDRSARPDGNGLEVRGGVGWTFRFDDFLVLVAPQGNFWQVKFTYDALRVNSDTLKLIRRDSTAIQRAFFERKTFNHRHTVSMLRFTIPLGLEYELVRKLHLRAGWVVEYQRMVNEDKSEEIGYRTTSDRLSFETVTFGMGFQISEGFRADFLSVGNLTLPRNWQISAIYTF